MLSLKSLRQRVEQSPLGALTGSGLGRGRKSLWAPSQAITEGSCTKREVYQGLAEAVVCRAKERFIRLMGLWATLLCC